MSISLAKDIATIVGVLVGAASLVVTAFNASLTVRTNRARFWLDLRERFARHDEVHRRLRPAGAWTDGGAPATADEWFQLESYMGLFEHCEVMLEEKLIDQRTFTEIYGYRLQNIVANRTIRVEKLEKNASGWTRFLALLKRMDISLPAM